MAQQYQYSPVEAGSIRLLHVVSVSPEIIFRVENASLDDNPTYNALSYTWGQPIFTERALLQGEYGSGYLNITPSLHHCLTNFDQYVETNIWIDALCINQRDDAEKSHQVRQMDRVYLQASKVLIWLGPSADDSDDAIKAMCTYGKEATDAGILKLRKNELSTWLLKPKDGDHKGGDHKDDAQTPTMHDLLGLLHKASDAAVDDSRIAERFPRVAFARLTHRDYFTRVWVKQEVTLARAAIVHCGSYSAPLEYFHALLLFYGMIQMWEAGQYNAGLSNRMPVPSDEGTIDMDGKTIHLIMTPMTNDAIGFHLSGRRKRQEEGPEPLYRLLHQSYVRGGDKPPLACFMPEDKIWGLSGIAGDIQDIGLKANYGVDSADKVYEYTTRALLKQGRVDMLKWCRTREGGLRSPSWVPDWRLPICEPWGEDTGEPVFKPFKKEGVPEDLERVVQPSTAGSISIQGIKVDAVADVGSPWHVDENASFSQASFIVLVQELLALLNKSRYSEEESMNALWRIPIGDLEFFASDSPYYVRATQRSLEQFQMLISKVSDSEMTRLTASYQTCSTRHVNAKPMRTENGWVGLTSGEVLPGDIITLLIGGTAPFILRPVASGDGNTHYLLVGECFMYGMMDGELADGKEDVVSFELR